MVRKSGLALALTLLHEAQKSLDWGGFHKEKTAGLHLDEFLIEGLGEFFSHWDGEGVEARRRIEGHFANEARVGRRLDQLAGDEGFIRALLRKSQLYEIWLCIRVIFVDLTKNCEITSKLFKQKLLTKL